MTRFKYSLDRSSKKFQCPSCDQKRFVRYVNTNTNEYCEEVARLGKEKEDDK